MNLFHHPNRRQGVIQSWFGAAEVWTETAGTQALPWDV